MLSLLKEGFLEWDSCITDCKHSPSLSESALSKHCVDFHSSKQCLFPHILSNTGPYPSLKFWPTWLVKMVSHLGSRLSIYIPPSVKCLFISFAHFSTGGPFLFDLYDRDIHPPSVTGVMKLLFPPGSHLSFVKIWLLLWALGKHGPYCLQVPLLRQQLAQCRISARSVA